MKTKSILVIALAFFGATVVNAQDKAKPAAKPAAKSQAAPAKVEAKPAVAPISTTPVAAPAATNDNPNAADFKFETEEHNFGNIKQGDVVNYDFKFSNNGKEPLIITTCTGSCGCTVPDWPKEPIKPGASGVIKVSFNSSGKSGMQDKTVTINSNAKTAQKVIHIKGNVEVPATPANTATPAPSTPAKMEPAPIKK